MLNRFLLLSKISAEQCWASGQPLLVSGDWDSKVMDFFHEPQQNGTWIVVIHPIMLGKLSYFTNLKLAASCGHLGMISLK